MYVIRIIIIFILLVSVHPSKKATGESLDPWSFNSPHVETSGDGMTCDLSPAAGALTTFIQYFRDYISTVDGDRCLMYPTCSYYSLLAVKKHGFIIGYIMTVDRLIHESNEMEIAEVVSIGEMARYYDSVENNDFWWYKQPHRSLSK